MLVGIALMLLAFTLPRGVGVGLLAGFMIFSLGIYGVAFQKWQSERGLWMLAVLLVVTLGPIYAMFSYLHIKATLFPQPPNPAAPQPAVWRQIWFPIEIAFSLAVFSRQVRMAVTVAIANWKMSRSSVR